jgi:hypothetical protein
MWPSRTVDLLVQPEWVGGTDVFPVVLPTLDQPSPDEEGWPGATPTNPLFGRPPLKDMAVPRIPRRPVTRPGGQVTR